MNEVELTKLAKIAKVADLLAEVSIEVGLPIKTCLPLIIAVAEKKLVEKLETAN